MRSNSQFDYYQGEELLVSCWCEVHNVLVPRTELLGGLTRPCNLRRCIEMNREKGGFVAPQNDRRKRYGY